MSPDRPAKDKGNESLCLEAARHEAMFRNRLSTSTKVKRSKSQGGPVLRA